MYVCMYVCMYIYIYIYIYIAPGGPEARLGPLRRRLPLPPALGEGPVIITTYYYYY